MSETFVSFVAGVIISSFIWWLIIRRRFLDKQCMKCNKKYGSDEKYCDDCGVRLKTPKIIYE